MKLPGLGHGVAVAVIALIALMSIFSFGRVDERVFPSSASYTPGGTAAFAELLRADGYHVSVDLGVRPHLRQDQVAIAFILQKSNSIQSLLQPEAETPRYVLALTEFMKSGGQVVVIHLPTNIQALQRSVDATRTIRPLDQRSRSWAVSYSTIDAPSFVAEPDGEYGLYGAGEDVYASYFTIGKGGYLDISDGVGVLNRYLKRGENAGFLLDMVHRVARPGSDLVFTEATFGNINNRGVFGEIGSWAVAFQWQFILILAVVAFTVGVRFGLPTWEQARVRSSRDLVDAVAEIYSRSKRSVYAIEAMRTDSLERMRIAVGAAQGAEPEDFLRDAPDGLRDLLLSLAEINPKITAKEALELGRKVEGEVAAFEESSRKRRQGTRV